MPKQFSLSTYQLVATKRILWHSLVVKWQLPDNLNKVPPGKELVVTAGQECIIIIVKVGWCKHGVYCCGGVAVNPGRG